MLSLVAGVVGVVVARFVAHLRRTGQTARLVLVTTLLTVAVVAGAVAMWGSPAGRLPWVVLVLAYTVTYALSPVRRDRISP